MRTLTIPKTRTRESGQRTQAKEQLNRTKDEPTPRSKLLTPNVIVICIDSLRADCVGPDKAMGHVKTPNIDKLASESVVFDRCYAEGLPTIQVRRCFFTGHRSYPWLQAIPDEGLQPAGPGWHPIAHDEDTLAEMLHDSGYLTGLVADTYHIFKPTMNFTRGFISWQFIRGQENDPLRSGPFDRIDLAAHVPDDEATPAHHPTVAQYLLNALDRKSEEDWQCAQVFRKAADWLVDNRSNGPFMLWVDSFTPHELWDPPRHYADLYCPAKPGVKDLIYPQVYYAQKDRRPAIEMTPDEVERCKALYLGFVTFMDRWVGHLLTTAQDLGLLDNTVIMFTTDHGTELMDKGRFGKGGDRLHPFNTRVPLFIRTPDGPRGLRCDAWSQNLDFTPTLFGLLGLEPREDFHGKNLWPIALGDAPAHRDYVTTGWGHNCCVRDDNWAVNVQVTKPDFMSTAQAYDLRTDPHEDVNVADKNPEAVKEAVARIEELTGPLPPKFEHYKQRAQGRTMRTFGPMRFGK